MLKIEFDYGRTQGAPYYGPLRDELGRAERGSETSIYGPAFIYASSLDGKPEIKRNSKLNYVSFLKNIFPYLFSIRYKYVTEYISTSCKLSSTNVKIKKPS